MHIMAKKGRKNETNKKSYREIWIRMKIQDSYKFLCLKNNVMGGEIYQGLKVEPC